MQAGLNMRFHGNLGDERDTVAAGVKPGSASSLRHLVTIVPRAGGGTATTQPSAGPVTVRAAIPAPAVGIEPVTINDEGGLTMFGQTGQYLAFSDAELQLVPVLAESWESNDANDVWTFSLRKGVRYHDGTEVKAQDVVATIAGIAAGNAGSAFETFRVDPANVVALDDSTVEFTLSQPSGSFPFFVSSDNYNAAILNLWSDLQAEANVAYLFISHDLNVVRYLADRVAVMYLGRLMEAGPARRIFGGPHHPSTEALLSAAPDQDEGTRIRLEGEIPAASDPPPGCPFQTRCHRKIGEICETVEPPLAEVQPGYSIRCHIPIEELAELQGIPLSA